jgi:protein tyrosine phosphatase
VTFKNQEVCGDYVIRKFEVMESQTRMSVSSSGFTVTQFQYVKWPEDGVPQSTTGILEVANLVQKVQMTTGNKAITVMCKCVDCIVCV